MRTRAAAGGAGEPDRQALSAALGVALEPGLLERALTHRSYAYENGGLPTNERLEFLGDAVLELVVTEALYRRTPEVAEGELAKQRAAVVKQEALAQVARALGLGAHLRLGRGEATSGGRGRNSILADGFEALLGAVYLTAGLDGACEVVTRLFDPLLRRAAQLGAGLDWKTSLQEEAAALGYGQPVYEITESGPDHAKQFTAYAVIDGRRLGSGTGSSKKQAEQMAAKEAYEALRRQGPQPGDGSGRSGTR